jgi:transcriptional regulator with XRE-family HTH domain
MPGGPYIGLSESTISRIELGRIRVEDEDLDRLLTLYGITDLHERQGMLQLSSRLTTPQWWHQYRGAMTSWFCSYFVLESVTETIRSYESRFIPGLLQTEAYASALFRLHHPVADQAHRRTQIRMQRQLMLAGPQHWQRTGHGQRPTRLWAIVDESALNEQIGDAAIMHDQLDALIRAAVQPNINIQILPSGTGGHTGVGNSFSLLRLRARILPDLVYLEHLTGAHFLDDPDEVDTYRVAIERLGITAMHPSDTITELEKAKRRLKLT